MKDRKLTQPARDLLIRRIRSVEREDLVEILEGCLCIQCYDSETVNDLIPALIDSVECGDLDFDDIPSTGDYKDGILWLDVDEIWED